MDENRVALFVGFAKKSGKLVRGGAVLKKIREEKARVALVSAEASDNTKKRYRNACFAHNIPFHEVPASCAGRAIGENECKVLAIEDASLARLIIDSMVR